MPDNKVMLFWIYRMLKPENRADLLTWVHLAYTAESSAKKSLVFDVQADNVSAAQIQEFFCKKKIRKEKEMKNLQKFAALLLVVGLIFSLTGCDEDDGDKGGSVSFKSFSPRSISVDNMTKERLVAFKGEAHRDYLIGGIPADCRGHGLEKKSSLFKSSQDFGLVLIKEADYNKYKNNLAGAPVFAEIYAFYNHEGDNQNSFRISNLVGGEGRIILNNPTNWNIEIRRNSPTGEILGYTKDQSLNTALRLEIPSNYNLYAVFKRYNHSDREIYEVVPKFLTAEPGFEYLIGTPYMQPFALPDAVPQTWNFGPLAQTLNFSLTSGGVYIRVQNDSGIAVIFSTGNGNTEILTSTGISAIKPGETNLYNLKVYRNPDGTYPARQTISGYSIGTALGWLTLPAREYKTDYIYTIRVTGASATMLVLGEIQESEEPMDLEAKFGYK